MSPGHVINTQGNGRPLGGQQHSLCLRPGLGGGSGLCAAVSVGTSYRALGIHPGTVEASVTDAAGSTGTHAARSKPPAGIPVLPCSATSGGGGLWHPPRGHRSEKGRQSTGANESYKSTRKRKEISSSWSRKHVLHQDPKLRQREGKTLRGHCRERQACSLCAQHTRPRADARPAQRRTERPRGMKAHHGPTRDGPRRDRRGSERRVSERDTSARTPPQSLARVTTETGRHLSFIRLKSPEIPKTHCAG